MSLEMGRGRREKREGDWNLNCCCIDILFFIYLLCVHFSIYTHFSYILSYSIIQIHYSIIFFLLYSNIPSQAHALMNQAWDCSNGEETHEYWIFFDKKTTLCKRKMSLNAIEKKKEKCSNDKENRREREDISYVYILIEISFVDFRFFLEVFFIFWWIS